MFITPAKVAKRFYMLYNIKLLFFRCKFTMIIIIFCYCELKKFFYNNFFSAIFMLIPLNVCHPDLSVRRIIK
jgi:hypothetical protein